MQTMKTNFYLQVAKEFSIKADKNKEFESYRVHSYQSPKQGWFSNTIEGFSLSVKLNIFFSIKLTEFLLQY